MDAIDERLLDVLKQALQTGTIGPEYGDDLQTLYRMGLIHRPDSLTEIEDYKVVVKCYDARITPQGRIYLKEHGG